MKKSDIKKRISSILFFCFITSMMPLGGNAVATHMPSQDDKTAPHKVVSPQLTHGNVAKANPKLKQNHMTLDDVKRNADLEAAVQPTLAKPDFAFPQTVTDDAEGIYKQALKLRQPVTALRAAMTMNVAENLVTTDSIRTSIERYRQLAKELPIPYSAIAQLLEAEMLSNLYVQNSWVYDNRTLPDDELNPNPALWSGAQFKKQVLALAEAVLRQQDALATTPISAIAPIITDAKEAEENGMSMMDFACYRLRNILSFVSSAPLSSTARASEIPFRIVSENGTPVDSPTPVAQVPDTLPAAPSRFSPAGILNRLIEIDEKVGGADSKALLIARLQKLNSLSGKAQEDYANSLMDTYPADNPLRPMVVYYAGSCLNRDGVSPLNHDRKYYALLTQTIADFPESPYAGCLEAQRDNLMVPDISFSVPGQAIPHTATEISYTLHNLKDCYLLLVPVKPPKYRSPYYSTPSYYQHELPTNSQCTVLTHLSDITEGPAEMSGKVNIPGVAPGYYVVVPSSTPTMKGLYGALSESAYPVINVCGFGLFTTQGKATGEAAKHIKIQYSPNQYGWAMRVTNIYVSDARTGAPVEGATVVCREITTADKLSGKETKLLTDKEGRVQCSYKTFICEVTHGGSRIETRLSKPSDSGSPMVPSYSATVLTDLALYHPGDTVGVAGVVVLNEKRRTTAEEGMEVELTLRDANNRVADTMRCVTDRFGRVSGKLTIPTDGLTGRFSVTLSEGGKVLGAASVQVAEYKSLSFKLRLDTPKQVDGNVVISGSALTYSGMPVADTKVDLTIFFREIWWWWRTGNHGYLPSDFNTSVTTDAQGRFSLTLDVSALDGTGYEGGYFDIYAIATSEAGETVDAAGQTFSIGSGFHVEAADSEIKVSGSQFTVPVRVTDILDKPADKVVRYSIRNNATGATQEGVFSGQSLTLFSKDFPSGEYEATFVLPEAMRSTEGADKGEWIPDTAKCRLVLWRTTDTRPPYATQLWLPEKSIYAPAKGEYTNVTAGSGYKNSVLFYQIASCDSIIQEGWVNASDANILLNVPVPAKDNQIRVYFRGVHDLQAQSGSVTVLPNAAKQKLQLVTETFRDRLVPGATEKWRFRFMCDDVPVGDAAAMAVMSDAALNAITPFRWSMPSRPYIRYNLKGGISTYTIGKGRFYGEPYSPGRRNPTAGCARIVIPKWNFWGWQPTFLPDIDAPVVAYGSSKRSRNGVREEVMMMDEEPVYFSAANDMIETAYGMVSKSQLTGSMAVLPKEATEMEVTADEAAVETGEPADEAPAAEDIVLRDTEHPLAFFKPLLISDAEGTVEVEFEVPDFNTTWAFQLLAYDADMRSAYLAQEAVAAKPVMVSTNMPRFLLTSDRATVAATLFNNSDSQLALRGRIDIIDATSGKLIAFSEPSPVQVAPAGSSVMTAEFEVPSDCGAVIIRSTVRSDLGSDGEQDIVQVLPSSQPVLDASTFYLTPDRRELSLTLPEMGPDDMVTLNYCDNPAWYVLTSLAGFAVPDSQSTLTNLNALYADCVAGGLMSRYPALRKGLLSFFPEGGQPDPMLTSPLETNAALKISTLQNTPWVNNARAETDRMHSLVSLTDPAAGEKAVSAILDALARNQMPDGGFKWMPQMKESSLWITRNVLDCAARLRENRFAPKGPRFGTMVTKALRYADVEMGREFQEARKKKWTFSLSTEMEYLLTRSILTSDQPSGLIDDMRRDMLRRIPKEWRKLSLADKTVAARIMHREGDRKLARQIMESVKQFASYKPDKGMWFDNTGTGWWQPSTKLLNALAVQALNEVLPGDEAIMRMCHFLVLSRQTEDWNLDLSPAAVTMAANAVLGSDLGWTDPNAAQPPVIAIDGVPLDLGDTQPLTGNVWLDLTPQTASGATLTVTRSASSPAWGGVLRQYVAPMKDVREHSVPQLKVTKRLLPVETVPGGEVAKTASETFSRGDRIRVTLTLEADRDLDYLLVQDRRGAFMQPADQLTEYSVQNGLWLLRETRDTSTNFYLTRLPKGEYIITYDVFADRDGEYSTGIATAQSQYYPVITAHSAGCTVTIK